MPRAEGADAGIPAPRSNMCPPTPKRRARAPSQLNPGDRQMVRERSGRDACVGREHVLPRGAGQAVQGRHDWLQGAHITLGLDDEL